MCEIPLTDKMREALKEEMENPSEIRIVASDHCYIDIDKLFLILNSSPTKQQCADMIFKLATHYAMLCDEDMTLADGNRVAYWTLEAMNSNTATGDMVDTDEVFDRLGEDV